MNQIRSETPARYEAGLIRGRPSTTSTDPRDDPDNVIAMALGILESRIRQPGATLNSPRSVRDYLRLVLAGREHEVFFVMFVDSQHGLLAFEEMFRGTLTQTTVHPREVVKAALKHNAAAVIFAHNHPSGHAEPSQADHHMTRVLKEALALVEVRVLDHIVIGDETVSFAERGLL